MVALGWQQLSEEPWKRLFKELWVGGRVIFSLCGENSWMLMCNVALFRWSMPRHECSLAASWRLTVWCRRRLQEWLCYSMSQRYVNIGLFLYHWQTHSCTMRNSFHTTKAHSCTTRTHSNTTRNSFLYHQDLFPYHKKLIPVPPELIPISLGITEDPVPIHWEILITGKLLP